MKFDLAASRALLDQSEEQVRKKLADEGGEVHEDVKYEKLEHVTRFSNPARFPGHVYTRDGRVEMVYIPAGDALEGLTRDDLEAQLRGKGERLRSRAGKQLSHYVHATRGVAYSADGDRVRFVEVFPPRTHEAYLSEIYRDRGPFKR